VWSVGCVSQSNTSGDDALADQATSERPVDAPGSPGVGGLRGRDLDVFNSPEFKRQMALSMLAETDIEPRMTGPEREAMIQIIELIQDGNTDKALRIIDEHRGEAASAVFDFTRGNIYFQREAQITGDDRTQVDQRQAMLHEAVAAYRVAVRKYPKYRRAWWSLGRIYVRESRWAEAAPALSKVIELGGGDPITYGLLGFCYSSLDKPVSAESAYRQAILLDPTERDWKMGLARAFFQQRRFADVAALTGAMLDENPDQVDLWLLQASAYLQMGQPLSAAENYQFVEAMGKAEPGHVNNLGDIYINQGLYELAVDAYLRAIDMDPAAAEPNRVVRAAKVLTARGELDQAERLILRIEQDLGGKLSEADQIDLLRMQARIAVANKNADREAEILDEILKRDPMDGQALLLLGRYHHRQAKPLRGDLAAIDEQADPDKAESVRDALKEAEGRSEYYFQRAEQIEEFAADALVALGQLRVDQRQVRAAIELFERAQQLKPREDIRKYIAQLERYLDR
jgi:tetratricopeptide (TPR) repeat protein